MSSCAAFRLKLSMIRCLWVMIRMVKREKLLNKFGNDCSTCHSTLALRFSEADYRRWTWGATRRGNCTSRDSCVSWNNIKSASGISIESISSQMWYAADFTIVIVILFFNNVFGQCAWKPVVHSEILLWMERKINLKEEKGASFANFVAYSSFCIHYKRYDIDG